MKKPFLITYIAIGVVSLGAIVPLTIWAASDTTNLLENEIIEAKLNLDDSVRLEYVENEKLDTTGIHFFYEDEEVSMEDLKIEYDFTISGTRTVTFTKELGNKQYQAVLPVHVYHIRHIDVRNRTLIKGGEGEEVTWDNSKLTVWAELNEPAKSFPRPEGFEEYQTVIELNTNQYTCDVTTTSTAGVYNVLIGAGQTSFTFNYYDQYTFNSKRILHLTNQSGNADKLTLFLENSTNDFHYINEVEQLDVTGKYLYEDSNGSQQIYNFAYTKLANSWTSVFLSEYINTGLRDYFDDETAGYKCEVNGTTFYATAEEWHKPILGEPRKQAEAVTDSTAITEYFVNETFNPQGVSMKIGEQLIPASEIDQITYNFANPGLTNVHLIEVVNGEEYEADLTVKVIQIYDYDLINGDVRKTSDGFDYSRVELWANLSEPTSRLEKSPSLFPNSYIVPNTSFTFSTTSTSVSGYYEVTATYLQQGITFGLVIESEYESARVLHMHNEYSTSDELTLFVTYNSANYEWGYELEIHVLGKYVYKTSDGKIRVYDFEYIKEANSWFSTFKSYQEGNKNRQVVDQMGATSDPDGFSATINSQKFYSTGLEWHGPILGQDW